MRIRGSEHDARQCLYGIPLKQGAPRRLGPKDSAVVRPIKILKPFGPSPSVWWGRAPGGGVSGRLKM